MSAVEVFRFPATEHPPKVKWGGYIYIVSFDNGTVKVGATKNPASRLDAHRQSGSAFGISAERYWVSPWHEGHLSNESRMIGLAHSLGGVVARREYFTNVSIERLARSVARRLTFPPVDVDSYERDAAARIAALNGMFGAAHGPREAPTRRDLVGALFGRDRESGEYLIGIEMGDPVPMDLVEQISQACRLPVESVMDMDFIDLLTNLAEVEIRTAALELRLHAIENGRTDLLAPVTQALTNSVGSLGSPDGQPGP